MYRFNNLHMVKLAILSFMGELQSFLIASLFYSVCDTL